MTTTLKQFQGSLVDPKDDARVYQFLGGVSGVVAGCVVTLYATNQLKVSDGWGFACGRVFVIEEEIVVANTAAAKGRIIVNIDLENIAKPACLATQSAAVLPALVQEDINADGTVFQLALAQYDIVSNTITNLTDVRVMLYDVDSRINAKVDLGETSSTAYRGDRGKIAYDHSQATGNPHGTTKSDIGLGNVDNTSDANKPISTAVQTALNAKQDGLTFDSTPTDGSSNPVASNGVYDALAAKQAGLSPSFTSASSVSVAHDTHVTLTSITLPPGTYLLFGYAQYATNGTNARGISISTSSTFDDANATKVQAVGNWQTAMTNWRYIGIASTTTMRLVAYQNSGSTLAVNVALFLALKIG